MAQADSNDSIPMPAVPTRRHLLTVAAGGGAAAVVAGIPTAAQAGGSPPVLTLIGGTAVLPTPAPRKARATAAEREAKAIQAGEMIERLLPAYVELYRLWAKGSGEAHAYVDANFSEEERYDVPKGAAHTTLRSIYASSGADLAQQAMNVLGRKIAPLVRLIEAAPAGTMEGLRAKALAAMYECVPASAAIAGLISKRPIPSRCSFGLASR
jgi:hypothetical protein